MVNAVDKEAVRVEANDNPPKPDQTPKRKRADQGVDEEQYNLNNGEKRETSARGGKTCRLSPQEQETSMSSDSEVDSSLLIETIAKEHELAGAHMTQDTSKWLTTMDHIDINASRGNENMSQQVKIVEVEGDIDAGLKNNSDYVVQLPSSECSD